MRTRITVAWAAKLKRFALPGGPCGRLGGVLKFVFLMFGFDSFMRGYAMIRKLGVALGLVCLGAAISGCGQPSSTNKPATPAKAITPPPGAPANTTDSK